MGDLEPLLVRVVRRLTARYRHWENKFCLDCHQDTVKMREYYMLTNETWWMAGSSGGMLCIGCIEDRLERTLTPGDFSDAPVNSLFKQSRRLRSRIDQSIVEI